MSLKSPLFCLLVGLSFFAANISGAQEKIRIGISLPLTGPAATYGIDTKNVLLFAAEKSAPGLYEFVIEDDKCNPKEAVNVAHKFLQAKDVKYVIGFACSGSLLASAPLYEKNGVLVMAALASSPEVSTAGDYIFRTRPTEEPIMEEMARFLSSRHSAVAILAEQTDYSQGTKEALKRKLAMGQTKVIEEDFFSDTVDLAPIVLKIKASRAEGVVVIVQSEQMAALVVRQLRSLLPAMKIYGSNAFVSKVFLNLIGSTGDGVEAISLPSIASALTPAGIDLYREYSAIHGEISSVQYTFYVAYEAFQALHQAISSKEDPRQFLYTRKFDGIFGSYSFDKNGDIVSGLTAERLIVKAGELVPAAK